MALPTLLYIIGPPAVGKMTVGGEIAARTGMRLFHNHLAIEPALRLFEFGTPPFNRLVQRFREHVIEEVAASDLPGLVFTLVLAFDRVEEDGLLERLAEPFHRRGARVLLVELEADQAERLRRNEGASRLAEKPSKRDLEWSRRHLLELDGAHRFTSAGEFDGHPDHLRVDNTHLSPAEVAERVIARFALPVSRCWPATASAPGG